MSNCDFSDPTPLMLFFYIFGSWRGCCFLALIRQGTEEICDVDRDVRLRIESNWKDTSS